MVPGDRFDVSTCSVAPGAVADSCWKPPPLRFFQCEIPARCQRCRSSPIRFRACPYILLRSIRRARSDNIGGDALRYSSILKIDALRPVFCNSSECSGTGTSRSRMLHWQPYRTAVKGEAVLAALNKEPFLIPELSVHEREISLLKM